MYGSHETFSSQPSIYNQSGHCLVWCHTPLHRLYIPDNYLQQLFDWILLLHVSEVNPVIPPKKCCKVSSTPNHSTTVSGNSLCTQTHQIVAVYCRSKSILLSCVHQLVYQSKLTFECERHFRRCTNHLPKITEISGNVSVRVFRNEKKVPDIWQAQATPMCVCVCVCVCVWNSIPAFLWRRLCHWIFWY